MNQPSKEQLDIIWHTLGLSPEQRESNRNHYVAGPGHYAQPILQALVEQGLMYQAKRPLFLHEGDEVFAVTDEGKQIALSRLPQPEKPPAGNYNAYLRADGCYDDFAHFLGITLPHMEYRNGLCRMIRIKHLAYGGQEVIKGTWQRTKALAKTSYKEALEARRFEKKALARLS